MQSRTQLCSCHCRDELTSLQKYPLLRWTPARTKNFMVDYEVRSVWSTKVRSGVNKGWADCFRTVLRMTNKLNGDISRTIGTFFTSAMPVIQHMHYMYLNNQLIIADKGASTSSLKAS